MVVQSYTPQHYAIQAAAKHDYQAFLEREMGFRQEHGYPPQRRMARLIYWDKNATKAHDAALHMATLLNHRLVQLELSGRSASILGTAPAFFARFRSYYRWQLLLPRTRSSGNFPR